MSAGWEQRGAGTVTLNMPDTSIAGMGTSYRAGHRQPPLLRQLHAEPGLDAGGPRRTATGGGTADAGTGPAR